MSEEELLAWADLVEAVTDFEAPETRMLNDALHAILPEPKCVQPPSYLRSLDAAMSLAPVRSGEDYPGIVLTTDPEIGEHNASVTYYREGRAHGYSTGKAANYLLLAGFDPARITELPENLRQLPLWEITMSNRASDVWNDEIAALEHLERRGFTHRLGIIWSPHVGYEFDDDETAEAVNYLCAEWDYEYDPDRVTETSTSGSS